MRSNWNPDLEGIVRTASPTGHLFAELAATINEHTRKTRAGWEQADSTAGFDLTIEDSARLNRTVVTEVGNTTQNGYETDLNDVTPFVAAKVSWGGPEAADFALHRVKAWLHPQQNGGNPKEVSKWAAQLYSVTEVFGDGTPADPYTFELMPLGDPVIVDAPGVSAGEITFDWGAQGPRPKIFRPTQLAAFPQPTTYLMIRALTATGTAAGNVGWGRDTLQSSVGTTNVLTSRTLTLDAATGRYQDTGAAAGLLYVVFESATYAAATLTFATNPFTMGGLPAVPFANPVELEIGRAHV